MRIFIVDDEEISCRGLKGMLGRIAESEGAEIYLFTDSEKALTEALRLRPEIIFLDIVMPKIDGVEFITLIRRSYDPAIVIISGNDDYSYVRQCFKQNVKDYLLKPIEFDELKAVFLRIKGDIFENAEKTEKYGGAEKYPYVFKAVIKGAEPSDDMRDLLLYSLDGKNRSVNAEIYRERNRETHFRFHLKDAADYEYAAADFEKFFNACTKKLGFTVKAAYSECYPAADENAADSELNDIMEGRIYSEVSCCYSPESRVVREGGNDFVFLAELKALPEVCGLEEISEYKRFAAEWFTSPKLSKLPYSTVKGEYTAYLDRLIESQPPDELEIRAFDEFNTIDETVFEIRRVTDGIYHYFAEQRRNDSDVARQAIKYISENYGKDITLATASNYFDLSYSYFSRMFKENIGVSFSQYLLKVRMEEARKMLLFSDAKIGDIAKRVGYNDENAQNFTRAFKNYFGKPPKDYKNQ